MDLPEKGVDIAVVGVVGVVVSSAFGHGDREGVRLDWRLGKVQECSMCKVDNASQPREY